ncbi:class I SAM-dependent methyltransferase [Burkholderia guangdongensis]|uniref:class I SAM-dependent methyltransferase n=1 Tax=Burkholderia guangdongensis TaxID=1792500 RepID=UPI0015CD43BB|nr:class I SAM-dependent methyltransferase [Burkholderia guangdongensis]
MKETSPPPHSHQYLDDNRYGWWRADSIRLLLERAGATRPSAIADIGTGQGHWLDAIASQLDHAAMLYGIDREACWLEDAEQRFRRHPGAKTFTPIRADAASIPLENDSIDIVTCQTLLMHCEDPAAVAREMVRVVRPGGTLLIVEPVNLLNRTQVFEMARLGFDKSHIDVIRFWSHYHAYLRREKCVDHDIGARLPDLFIGTGARDIALFQNDTIMIGAATDRPTSDDYEYASPEVRAAFADNEHEQALYARGRAAFDKLDRAIGTVAQTYPMRQNLVVMLASK